MPSDGGRSAATPNEQPLMSDQNKVRGARRAVSPPSHNPHPWFEKLKKKLAKR